MRWNYRVWLSCGCKVRLINVLENDALDLDDETECVTHGAVTVTRRQGHGA